MDTLNFTLHYSVLLSLLLILCVRNDLKFHGREKRGTSHGLPQGAGPNSDHPLGWGIGTREEGRF